MNDCPVHKHWLADEKCTCAPAAPPEALVVMRRHVEDGISEAEPDMHARLDALVAVATALENERCAKIAAQNGTVGGLIASDIRAGLPPTPRGDAPR